MIVNSYTINLNFGKDKIFLSIRYFFIHQESLNVIFAILSWLMANSFWMLAFIKLIIMRIVIQRVSEASVSVERKVISKIEEGMLILLGIEDADTEEDVEWLCNKLTKLRIFSDENDAMNLDINQIEGSFLVVSQFTLHAMTKKGNRPSFIKAARPEKAIPLYETFLKRLSYISGRPVQCGEFGAMMEVALVNDGPVTIIMDTKDKE